MAAWTFSVDRPEMIKFAGNWEAKASAVASPKLPGETPVMRMVLPCTASGKEAVISAAGVWGVNVILECSNQC